MGETKTNTIYPAAATLSKDYYWAWTKRGKGIASGSEMMWLADGAICDNNESNWGRSRRRLSRLRIEIGIVAGERI